MNNQKSSFHLPELEKVSTAEIKSAYIFKLLEDLRSQMEEKYAPTLKPRLFNTYLADDAISLTFSISVPPRAGFSWEVFEVRFKEDTGKFTFHSSYYLNEGQANEGTIFEGNSEEDLNKWITAVLSSREFQGHLQQEYSKGRALEQLG